jgi:hypothetical protein
MVGYENRENSLITNLQMTKTIWPQITKCHICGKSANPAKYLSPQICGFAICRIYFQADHLPIRFTFVKDDHTYGGFSQVAVKIKIILPMGSWVHYLYNVHTYINHPIHRIQPP